MAERKRLVMALLKLECGPNWCGPCRFLEHRGGKHCGLFQERLEQVPRSAGVRRAEQCLSGEQAHGWLKLIPGEKHG